MKITLDRKILFLLSSETRIEILKKLDERRMTLSELSKALGLSKTTVKEHLNKLLEAGLVERVEEGRKWIYYELTPEGKRLLHPEKVSVKLVISTIAAVSSMILGVFELFRFKAHRVAEVTVKKVPTPTPVPSPTPAKVPTPTPAITKTPTTLPKGAAPEFDVLPKKVAEVAAKTDIHFYLGLVLIFAGTLLIAYALRKFR